MGAAALEAAARCPLVRRAATDTLSMKGCGIFMSFR
jgi:hypothetical protein